MDEFYWIAVAVVVITSSARLTRLATFDKFPPTLWLRNAYGDLMDRRESTRPWALLAYCGYCASFWATAAVVLWGLWAGVLSPTGDTVSGTPAQFWWLFNGTLGASYLAAILMAYDGDASDPLEDEGADQETPFVMPDFSQPTDEETD